MMELSKFKTYIPAIVAVITTISSVFMAGKHYLDNEFVNVSDFDRSRLNMSIYLLENRKLTLESRIYLYRLCKISPNCPDKNVDVQLDKDLRDLDDIRNQLETLRKKLFN